jgi:predicted metalloprotease
VDQRLDPDGGLPVRRPRRFGPKSALAAALSAIALASACAIPQYQPQAQQTTPAQPQSRQVVVPRTPVQSPLPTGMAQDENFAVQATNTFWTRHFAEQFGGNYSPPQIAGGYLGTQGPPCGGQPSVPFNAFYCQPGDFIAWDENLMSAGYKQIGDSWVYLIISHEWGHAIQARVDRSLVSVAAELQADCLAGATLQGASRDGTVRFEAGDAQELSRTLSAVADNFAWTKESDHGNARQRIQAFNAGARTGAQACIPRAH